MWGTASLLNAIWLDEAQPPEMIITWMEAHAIAAHSVYFSKDHLGGCLQCNMTAAGRPQVSVTEWKEDPTPSCAKTQPF